MEYCGASIGIYDRVDDEKVSFIHCCDQVLNADNNIEYSNHTLYVIKIDQLMSCYC